MILFEQCVHVKHFSFPSNLPRRHKNTGREPQLKQRTDQQDGTQEAYIAQFKNEYALCEAAGEADDVLLPAWTVQTMTGKGTAFTDETVWTNESMAHYFGVRSVKAAE